MDDYKYHPYQHTLDRISQFFQNIPIFKYAFEGNIIKAVEKMAIPSQDINIEAIKFEAFLTDRQ